MALPLGEVSPQVIERVQPTKKKIIQYNKGLLHRMPCSSPCYHYKIFSYASAVMAATASTMAPSTMR